MIYQGSIYSDEELFMFLKKMLETINNLWKIISNQEFGCKQGFQYNTTTLCSS